MQFRELFQQNKEELMLSFPIFRKTLIENGYSPEFVQALSDEWNTTFYYLNWVVNVWLVNPGFDDATMIQQFNHVMAVRLEFIGDTLAASIDSPMHRFSILICERLGYPFNPKTNNQMSDQATAEFLKENLYKYQMNLYHDSFIKKHPPIMANLFIRATQDKNSRVVRHLLAIDAPHYHIKNWAVADLNNRNLFDNAQFLIQEFFDLTALPEDILNSYGNNTLISLKIRVRENNASHPKLLRKIEQLHRACKESNPYAIVEALNLPEPVSSLFETPVSDCITEMPEEVKLYIESLPAKKAVLMEGFNPSSSEIRRDDNFTQGDKHKTSQAKCTLS